MIVDRSQTSSELVVKIVTKSKHFDYLTRTLAKLILAFDIFILTPLYFHAEWYITGILFGMANVVSTMFSLVAADSRKKLRERGLLDDTV